MTFPRFMEQNSFIHTSELWCWKNPSEISVYWYQRWDQCLLILVRWCQFWSLSLFSTVINLMNSFEKQHEVKLETIKSVSDLSERSKQSEEKLKLNYWSIFIPTLGSINQYFRSTSNTQWTCFVATALNYYIFLISWISVFLWWFLLQ